MTLTTRLVTPADAPAIAALITRNRQFLAPWEPVRPEEYFTAEGQREIIKGALAGPNLPHVILLDGEIIGRITINNIVRGPFQSGSLGYWVGQEWNGRGIATAAVAAFVPMVFREHGLHRIEAGTLVHNHGSQKVLARNGFVRFGLAPRYLQIAGEWQDHILHQRLSE